MPVDVSWKELSEAYAFVGNSLLKPMTQTSDVGLDPAFWEAFPTFGSSEVAGVCAALAAYALAAREAAASDGRDAVECCAVEYTRLFVGPPRPAAAPWETMYRGGAAVGGATVGFGQATFEMRALLREAGLEVKNENNQYEDHIGIELLYLALRPRRRGGGGGRRREGGARHDRPIRCGCRNRRRSGVPFCGRGLRGGQGSLFHRGPPSRVAFLPARRRGGRRSGWLLLPSASPRRCPPARSAGTKRVANCLPKILKHVAQVEDILLKCVA